MIQHYKDLIQLFWLRILVGAVVAGTLAAALSLLLLQTSPAYKASVTFNMQPSEEALSFNRQFLGVSQFNPATIITETHIERLLSRPIADRTLDKFLADQGPTTGPIEPSLFSRFKLFLWKSWTRLNYGEYRPVPERDQMRNDLLESLDVEPVAGSYILKLTASYKFPSVAADIANTHAQSYIEAASEEFQAQLDSRAGVLQDRIDSEEAALADLLSRREQLRAEFDIANLSRESEILMSSLQGLREDLEDDELQRRLRLNEVDSLTRDQNNARSRGEVADLQDEIEVLEQRIAFREEQIETQSDELSAIARSQLDFDTLALQIDEVEAKLNNLREQLLSFELGAQSSSSQIQIVSPASVPVYPSSPKVFVFTVAAMIVGASLVFMTIVLQELFGSTIRTSHDLQQYVGSRALPSVSRAKPGGRSLIKRTLNNRRMRRFIQVFGQKMSVGSGWRSNKIIVTGFGRRDTVIEARDLLADVVRNSIALKSGEKPFEVTSVGPIFSVKDWDTLGDGQLVVVMEPNEHTADEVENMLLVGDRIERKPLFMLWT